MRWLVSVLGRDTSVFLGSNGVVYASGINDDAECGLGPDMGRTIAPTEIGYFREHGIEILDIPTTAYHWLHWSRMGRFFHEI